ncbi:unnamed protein product [Acanthoscelides obtectus]|uniref:Antistasin-like domain-containing protein n=1 Tax=Acanthoscelides obtectus TaxID=200917 RepID=A0A9P0QCF4_ACAOB|nr:unnamed protein product [Acanthoscelides obtectus]CAK1676887.1 Cysteine-rich motor neuron 1 protein [Acanthoscelides obtectus]
MFAAAAIPIDGEACPEDSVPAPWGGCVCRSCPSTPPPECMFELVPVEDTGGGEGMEGTPSTTPAPGRCCPRYECVGCRREEDKLQGRCQCAKGAIIDRLGRTCRCIDPHKTLVNGECVCDELKCRLPDMCNRKSVAVQVQRGCCKTTVCTPCPPDSESTALDSDLLEDHCVCLPCHTNCGYNETVIIKKKGSGFPGNCCDLYECRAADEAEEPPPPPPSLLSGGGEDAKAAADASSAIYCLVGDVRHPNGATWTTKDEQICHCISGLSRCSSEKMHQLEKPCFVDLKWYANGENWTKEDGCTQCICRNGEQQCISHFCEVKESHIHSSDGDTDADQVAVPSVECQPLADCDKSCTNGYKINRHGCEVCMCNEPPPVIHDKNTNGILEKYNISMEDLIRILDEYKHSQRFDSSSTSTTTTTTTTSSTSTINAVLSSGGTDDSEALSSQIWKEMISRAGESKTTLVPVAKKEETKEEHPASIASVNGTAGPAVTAGDAAPADGGDDVYTIVLVCCLAGVAACATAFAAACLYRNRRKSSSVDLTRCRYEHVDAVAVGTARTAVNGANAVNAPTLLLLNNNNNEDIVKKKTNTATIDPLL